MLDNMGMETSTERYGTFRISYDDGVISGSGNPGWLVEWPTDSGDWMSLDDPFGPFAGIEVPEDADDDQVAALIRQRRHPEDGVTLVGDGLQRAL